MIIGIGTDIVRVARMQANIEKYGDKFARRILTSDELDEYQRNKCPANFLAKRFAAKEATAKAFGLGFTSGLTLQHISVGHDGNGRPKLEYEGRARELCGEMGVDKSHISIADEDEFAIAFVTLASD